MGLLDSLRKALRKQPASPKPEVAKRTRAVVKQKRPRKRKAPPKIEHQMLREWRAEIKKISQHPLTQAKIINERLLATIMDLLNEINTKIDELNTRMAQLEASKKPKEEKPKIRLSSGEQKVMDYVKKKKQTQASDVSRALGISRSNAALKLNKLFSLGLLEKRQDGKDVYYTLA